MAVVSLVVAGLGLSACQQQGPKQTIGTLGGAALGGLAGSQIGKGKGQLVAVGAGVLLGAFLGSEIGKSLDKADQAYAAQTSNQALENNPVGQKSSWSNPDSGNSGAITPTRTTYNDAGQPCREFQQTIVVGGKTQSAYGTACRDANGDWKIVNQ
ncbi:MAG: glycine zipper 2TM domain-containing protein [Alphaproteobacteria bacterium]|nr:glycine zipper 2TM domain-containing protein [Alphaproteobacteria bacterium]